ncbi:MAG: glycoside hydrolase family 88 protein [Spirochaetaceae bacterium]|jgi:unsaturated rhamnogalacturonyl hydrolase|nr:glycoside hydrolase family 88 protein [Spirochaetaceae bacterium]
MYKEDEISSRVFCALLGMQRFSWEQGTASHYLMDAEKDEFIVQFAHDAVVRQLEDGRLAMMGEEGSCTDPASNGEAVLKAFELTGDPIYQQAHRKMLDFILFKAPRTQDGIIYHRLKETQLWVDSMYMIPPFLAKSGYPQKAFQEIHGLRLRLMDKATHLYGHIYDEEKKEFLREDKWGGGNGWTAAGFIRTLRFLPLSMKEERGILLKWFTELLDALLPWMRKDGFFHDIVDNLDSFIETNLSQMLAWSIFEAIKEKYIGAEYLEPAKKMWEAAKGKVDSHGYIQGVGGAPHFNTPGTSPEGQTFFLLTHLSFSRLSSVGQG